MPLTIAALQKYLFYQTISTLLNDWHNSCNNPYPAVLTEIFSSVLIRSPQHQKDSEHITAMKDGEAQNLAKLLTAG